MAKRDEWTESPHLPEMPATPAIAKEGEAPGASPGATLHACTSLPSVVFGTLLAMDECGTPLVCCGPAGGGALAARSAVALDGRDIGAQVALAFEAGDPSRPVVLGVLREDGANGLGAAIPAVEASFDGQRLLVSARDRLVLRCGAASITLTSAGKVLIYGTYVLSHSTGANRLKGGSIQLN